MLWGNVKPFALVKLSKYRESPILCGNVKPSALVRLSKNKCPPTF